MITSSIRELCTRENEKFALHTQHTLKGTARINDTSEIFTPIGLVFDVIEHLPSSMWDDGKTMLDPTCGNGQFLAAVAIAKREMGHSSVLASVYGVDLMPDNVAECQERLLAIAGNTAANRAIVEQNIICADGLRYHFRFDGSHRYDDEQDDIRFNSIFGEPI